MALLDSTLSLIAFKQLQGKSMTDVNKGVGNEAEGIKLNVDSSTIFINEIDSTPATSVFLGVAEFVSADLILDNTSNNQAYFATYPIGHPKAGQRVINAISPTYGSGYEAKPFAGANPIAVNDPIDWIYQYQSGIFYFQDPGSLSGTPTSIDLYVYTGDLLSDILGNIQTQELDWEVTTADDLQMIPTGNVLPKLDDNSDLGSATLRWKDIYLGSKIDFATDLEFNNVGSTITKIDSTGISLSLNKKLKSSALNKSEISFGVNGDEIIISNDGGLLSDAYLILNAPNIIISNTTGEFSSSSLGMLLRNSLKIETHVNGNFKTRLTDTEFTILGNTLSKYENQPDTQPGFDDYTMVTKKWVEDLMGGSGTGAGGNIPIDATGTNNYIGISVTGYGPQTGYSQDVIYLVTFANDNTAPSTLSIDGLPALDIFKGDETLGLVPLEAGDIQSAITYYVIYDGTEFQIYDVNPAGSVGTYTNLAPSTIAVGGVPVGTTFNNITYTNLFNMMFYPYIQPQFTSFAIAGQSTTLEVGQPIAAGSKTFNWTTSYSNNIKVNTIKIRDLTTPGQPYLDTNTIVTQTSGSLVVGRVYTISSFVPGDDFTNVGAPSNATGVIFTSTGTTPTSWTNSSTLIYDDGTEVINFASPIVRTSAGSWSWGIYGNRTNNSLMSRTFSVSWLWRRFYGTSTLTSLTAGDIQGLANNGLASTYAATYTYAAGGYKYLCIPSAFSNPVLFRDFNTNLQVAMAGPAEGYTISNGNGYYYQLVSVNNGYVTHNYEVYRTKYQLGGIIKIIVT